MHGKRCCSADHVLWHASGCSVGEERDSGRVHKQQIGNLKVRHVVVDHIRCQSTTGGTNLPVAGQERRVKACDKREEGRRGPYSVCNNFKPTALCDSLFTKSLRSPDFGPHPAWHSWRLHWLIFSACTGSYFEILCEHAAQTVVAAMPATLNLATGYWE